MMPMKAWTALLALALLGACGEQPQRLAAAEQPGYETDRWTAQQRARTLHQGEARRIYN